MIVIGAAVRDVPSRAVLVELVDALSHHPEGRTTPVVAMLDEWHRDLIVSLRKAGLERICVQAYGQAVDSMEVFRMASRYPARFDIRQILSRLCPFLRYPVFDGGRELTACGGWRNCMVLGGDRLKFVCQTTDHRFCDFFRGGDSTP